MSHTLTELVMGAVPIVVEETRGFWEGTLAHELRVQACNACGEVQLPAGPCCGACWSQDLTWRAVSGDGVVYSFTIVRHAFHPSFATQLPYVVADVQLDEGPVMTSTVTNIDPDELWIGMPVTVWFDEEVEDAFHAKLRLPKFKPKG